VLSTAVHLPALCQGRSDLKVQPCRANQTNTPTREAQISGWSLERIGQDVSRDGFNIEDVGEVAIWLARNGSSDLRRRIAEQVMPEVLRGLGDFLIGNVLPGSFARGEQSRKERGRKISRTKRGGDQ